MSSELKVSQVNMSGIALPTSPKIYKSVMPNRRYFFGVSPECFRLDARISVSSEDTVMIRLSKKAQFNALPSDMCPPPLR